MSDHLFRLMERHQKLDTMIDRAQRRHGTDPFEILRLKKLKLGLKDRMARLLRQPSQAR